MPVVPAKLESGLKVLQLLWPNSNQGLAKSLQLANNFDRSELNAKTGCMDNSENDS